MCLSVPTLDELKIWQRQVLLGFLEGPNKFCQSSASGPLVQIVEMHMRRGKLSTLLSAVVLELPSSCRISTLQDLPILQDLPCRMNEMRHLTFNDHCGHTQKQSNRSRQELNF